ncbi:sulfotransferase domain-containing protein [Aliarcobacter sp. ERUVET-8]|uniref:sulfotransferase domain-containing protein n=1 Tax=Aliarcobacter sp. ERUVET-8 TaxID=3429684 RepID=UPI003D6AAB24
MKYIELYNSKKTYYIKTHLPPKDDSKSIYIVRDGRKASLSYFHFMKKFFPEAQRSLLEILLGNDYYGEWTEHFFKWNPQKRENTLLLKYEDLLNNTKDEIYKIEKFLSIRRKKEWVNPFDKLQQKDSNFFRQGETAWNTSKEWSNFHENIFQVKHKNLMEQLGYDYEINYENKVSDKDIKEILSLYTKVNLEKNMYEIAAKERLELINKLDSMLKKK